MAKQPTHNVVLYPEGEDEKYGTRVGAAWPIKDGGFSIRLDPGISISNAGARILIVKRQERSDDNERPGQSYE